MGKHSRDSVTEQKDFIHQALAEASIRNKNCRGKILAILLFLLLFYFIFYTTWCWHKLPKNFFPLLKILYRFLELEEERRERKKWKQLSLWGRERERKWERERERDFFLELEFETKYNKSHKDSQLYQNAHRGYVLNNSEFSLHY